MKDLRDIIATPRQRFEVVTDTVQLIDQEVKSKKGLSGMAVKAAFSVIKAIKPRIMEETVHALLDEFVSTLQPYYERFQREGEAGTMETYLVARAPEVAENLLGITDLRARHSTNSTMVKAYEKLRPKGKDHVQAAVPGIGRLLDKHLAQA